MSIDPIGLKEVKKVDELINNLDTIFLRKMAKRKNS